MKKLQLTQGKFALVDDDIYEEVSKLKWFFDGSYAARKSPKKIYLHRFIMNNPKDLQVDHINRNTLDNRRSNLRSVKKSINLLNTGLWKHNTSGFKGVVWSKPKNRWVSQIKINQKNIYLGSFVSIIDANIARKNAERKYYV